MIHIFIIKGSGLSGLEYKISKVIQKMTIRWRKKQLLKNCLHYALWSHRKIWVIELPTTTKLSNFIHSSSECMTNAV